MRDVCVKLSVNKGESVVKDKSILSLNFSSDRGYGFRDQSPSGSLRRIIRGGVFSTNHQFGQNCNHDSFIRTPNLCWGARAPTQPVGLAFVDQNTFQATLDERTCGYGVCVRSIQYIRIASLRALATSPPQSVSDGSDVDNPCAVQGQSGPRYWPLPPIEILEGGCLAC